MGAWCVVGVLLAAALATVVVPFLEVLSLDFRALAENERTAVYVGHFYDEDLRNLGSAFVRFGPLPLVVLALAGVLMRLRARWGLGGFPPSRLPRRARLGVGVLAALPFLIALAPLSLALAVWVLFEVSWWLRWSASQENLLYDLFLPYAVVFATGLLALGAAGLRVALTARRSPPARGPLRRWGRRLALLLLFGPVVLLNVVLAVPVLAHGGRVWPVRTGMPSYVERCGTCHAASAPLFFVETPDEWRARLERFEIGEKAQLGPEQMDEVWTFLVGMRSFSDEWTFRSRWQRCHGLSSLTWSDRHPEDWAGIVDRVARTAPHYYYDSVKEQLVRFLREAYGSDKEAMGLAPTDYADVRAATRACTPCHFLSREMQQHEGDSEEAAVRLVRRMAEKMVPPPGEDLVRAIARGYRRIVSSPEAWRRLVPHDGPPARGGLPW